jgi:predicted DNA-binding transcriptional regulator YafY
LRRGDGPRYLRLEDLLDLVLRLQGSAFGLTLDEIAQEYGVSRRKAERMRDAIDRVFGLEALASAADRRKRWRLRDRRVPQLVRLAAAEVGALEAAARRAAEQGRPDHAGLLRGLRLKLEAALRPEEAVRLAPDVEALVEADGVAMRAGPRPTIRPEVVEALRGAILARRKVRLHHRARGRQEVRLHRVHPYGFLFGSRHYLVAWSRPANRHLLYALPAIERVDTLDEPYEVEPGIDLRRFAENSFGVFQETPLDVVWRFQPEVAAEARRFRFHPRQELESEPDGSLLVRFRAGGLLEMAWHLFTWGASVEVLGPPGLRELLIRLLEEALAWHGARPA